MKGTATAIDSLLDLSARIGRNPLLVQASSGNTSLKVDGTLWIKASGKWLAYADREEILVPVDVSECLECLRSSRALPAKTNLRPSIETFMHAILPQRVVVHVHSVNTIAWAVRSDATSQLSERLKGLRWQWIPYTLSGMPLAREIQSASSNHPGTDIFVLGNHGLVVCGEDCDSAESLLFEVERRLAIRPRAAADVKPGVLEQVARLSHWRLPDADVLHTLGADVISQRIVDRGVLYPCQAIFLGAALPQFAFSKGLSEIDGASPVVVVAGSGVLTNENITAAEWAMLNGFAEVVRRIETSAPIRYLTDQEVNSVLGADGHHYRMSAENQAKRA
jgi:rhamnose utilization protein RhaD (predicted bifunctional aldolase and dehydrogenase)